MFWKIKTKEYKELKLQIELLWMEVDILTQRYKRKVKSSAAPEEIEGSGELYDGFNDLRKINKQHPPK